ncbi:MAG: hypothetical protein COB93_04650 [Sneathiella sp.]|nr:MAG: hypothetical protein COB93_04650 [Sneathiella sp.]
MFWNRIPHRTILDIGHLIKTMSLRFPDLQSSVVIERLQEMPGSIVETKPFNICLKNVDFPEVEFMFEIDSDSSSTVKFLRAVGKDDLEGVEVLGRHNNVIARWVPQRLGHLISKTQVHFLETLLDEYGIRYIPSWEGIQNQNSEKTMAASVAAAVITAFADGDFTATEKERLVHVLSVYKSGFLSPQEILALTETTIKMWCDEGRDAWPATMHSLTVGLDAASKKTVLHAAGLMALTDGVFSVGEQKKLAEVAHWIGVDSNDFGVWAREFSITISFAKIMGLTME